MALSTKQRTFSKLVAQGLPRTDAYEQVYGKRRSNPSSKSRGVQARQLGANPKVKAEIQAYEDRFTPVGDLRVLREQMMANIRWLATDSPDQKVRLAASLDLRNYCDDRVARDAANRKTITLEALVREIGALEAPAAEPTIELETVDVAAEAAEAAVTDQLEAQDGADAVVETAESDTDPAETAPWESAASRSESPSK